MYLCKYRTKVKPKTHPRWHDIPSCPLIKSEIMKAVAADNFKRAKKLIDLIVANEEE